MTVTGINDGTPDGDQVVNVTISVDVGSSDALFGTLLPQQVTVTVTDINE